LMQTAKKILPRFLNRMRLARSKNRCLFPLKTGNISYTRFMIVALHDCCCPRGSWRLLSSWIQNSGDRSAALFSSLPPVSNLQLFLSSSAERASPKRAAQRLRYMAPSSWARGAHFRAHAQARSSEALCSGQKKRVCPAHPIFHIEGQAGTFAAKIVQEQAGWMPYAENSIRLVLLFDCDLAILTKTKPPPCRSCYSFGPGLPVHRLAMSPSAKP